MRNLYSKTVLAAVIISSCQAWNNGIGLKPPMGWTTENLAVNSTEASIKALATYFVTTGLSSYGYLTIGLGEGWQNG